MKRLLFILCAVIGITGAVSAQQKKTMNKDSKTLVTYFSATGTTADAARKLAAAIGADLFAIEPAQPYTNADLNWHDKKSRSSVEMQDSKSRPALRSSKLNVSGYEVVYIGFPIWWDLAPRVINTFIETYNLKGKTVIPFATSGGSTITNSAAELKKSYPELKWKQGALLNRTDEKTIRSFITH